jgi:hypothetical protein
MMANPIDLSLAPEQAIARKLRELQENSTYPVAVRKAGGTGTGATGPPGANGATWFSGAAVPSGAEGSNGDFYLRTATDDVYKKATGTWSIVTNIKGEKGETGGTGGTGLTGPQGEDAGINYTFSTTITEANPGVGQWRANNATFTSITKLFINRKAAELMPWFARMVAGGILYFQGAASFATQSFILKAVPALQAGSEWYVIEVEPLGQNGTFTNGMVTNLLYSPPGVTGPKGEAGAAAFPNGTLYVVSTNTTIANPGARFMRLNSATLSAVTQIAFSEKESAEVEVQELLKQVYASTSAVKGYIMLTGSNPTSSWTLYKVTAGVDEGEWQKLTVAYVAGPGGWSGIEGLPVWMTFTRNGDVGPEGPNTAGVWRDVMEGGMISSPALPAGTYLFTRDKEVAAEETGLPLQAEWLDPAAYEVAGKTTQYRIVCSGYTNATAPVTTFRFGLYRITASTGIEAKVKLTKEVLATTVAIAAPLASSLNNGESAAFTAPTKGHFALGCVLSATTAAKSQVILSARLQVRNI